MRHAVTAVEVTREIGVFRQQDGGRATRETLAIADQVGLVIVAAPKGRFHPVARWILESMEHVGKALNARKNLGRKTYLSAETPLELTRANSKFPRERSDVRGASGKGYGSNGLAD